VSRKLTRSAFLAGLGRLVEDVYNSNPLIPDRRSAYPWVTGYLGDPFSPVWFIAESPSLSRLETASVQDDLMTPEMQWAVSPGDKLFRQMLTKHGLKRGGPFDPGGWCCYITDVIKSSYRVRDWAATPEEARFAVAEAWSPVLRYELELGEPRLVVVLGKTATQKPLDHLVRRRLIAPLPETITIYHYSYIGSRPSGPLGPMHPNRIKAWDEEFARIAKRARALA
jgi:hypothetical protein